MTVYYLVMELPIVSEKNLEAAKANLLKAELFYKRGRVCCVVV